MRTIHYPELKKLIEVQNTKPSEIQTPEDQEALVAQLRVVQPIKDAAEKGKLCIDLSLESDVTPDDLKELRILVQTGILPAHPGNELRLHSMEFNPHFNEDTAHEVTLELSKLFALGMRVDYTRTVDYADIFDPLGGPDSLGLGDGYDVPAVKGYQEGFQALQDIKVGRADPAKRYVALLYDDQNPFALYPMASFQDLKEDKPHTFGQDVMVPITAEQWYMMPQEQRDQFCGGYFPGHYADHKDDYFMYDEFIHYFVDHPQKRFVGKCYGQQNLARAYGGDLLIAEDDLEPGVTPHLLHETRLEDFDGLPYTRVSDPEYIALRALADDAHQHESHEVTMARGSIPHLLGLKTKDREAYLRGEKDLHELPDVTKKTVCVHHNAVSPKEVGEGLRITAMAPDFVIEGLESANRTAMSMQSHDERLLRYRYRYVEAKMNDDPFLDREDAVKEVKEEFKDMGLREGARMERHTLGWLFGHISLERTKEEPRQEATASSFVSRFRRERPADTPEIDAAALSEPPKVPTSFADRLKANRLGAEQYVLPSRASTPSECGSELTLTSLSDLGSSGAGFRRRLYDLIGGHTAGPTFDDDSDRFSVASSDSFDDLSVRAADCRPKGVFTSRLRQHIEEGRPSSRASTASTDSVFSIASR